jgi:hypothetical protein
MKIIFVILIFCFLYGVEAQSRRRDSNSCNNKRFEQITPGILQYTEEYTDDSMYKLINICYNTPATSDGIYYRPCSQFEYLSIAWDAKENSAPLNGKYISYSSSDGDDIDVLIFNGAFTDFSEVDMSEEYYYEFKIRCCAHPFPINNGESNT